MSGEIEMTGDGPYMHVTINGKDTLRKCEVDRMSFRSYGSPVRALHSYRPLLRDGEILMETLDGKVLIVQGLRSG